MLIAALQPSKRIFSRGSHSSTQSPSSANSRRCSAAPPADSIPLRRPRSRQYRVCILVGRDRECSADRTRQCRPADGAAPRGKFPGPRDKAPFEPASGPSCRLCTNTVRLARGREAQIQARPPGRRRLKYGHPGIALHTARSALQIHERRQGGCHHRTPDPTWRDAPISNCGARAARAAAGRHRATH